MSFDRLRLWLKANLHRRRHEREMREEMAAHHQRATALLMARGLSEEDAKKEALREFGNVAYMQTEARQARGTLWLDALRGDARFALRHYARRPVTTLVMFVILAVGMSISSMLFSWVHSYAFQPPPAVTLTDGMVRIRGSSDGGDGRISRRFSEEEFLAYRALTTHFGDVAGWIDALGIMVHRRAGDDDPMSAHVTFVTDNYFDLLGAPPTIGAGLPKQAPGNGAASAVIDYATWQDIFAGSADAMGRTLDVNGIAVTVVGVARERFTGARASSGMHLWMPLAAKRLIAPKANPAYQAVARLREGVTASAAGTAAQTIASRYHAANDDARVYTDVVRLLATNTDPMFERDLRLQIVGLGVLATLVLLVACTNVSALLTGMASARRQEMAIRLSLGAARSRIIRQLITESAVLAIVAAAAALGAVMLITRGIIALIPDIPLDLGMSWSLTTFTFAVALAVGVGFGLSPALHATRMALAHVLRDSISSVGGPRPRLQQSLVVAQIAFTQPLIVGLVGVLLLVIGTLNARTLTDSPDRVVTFAVILHAGSPEALDDARATVTRLAAKLEATPGVERTVLTWGREFIGNYTVQPSDGGIAGASASLSASEVGAGYFDVLDIPVKSGRTFDARDLGTPAAKRSEVPVVIGADVAALLWGNADPVGRRLQAMTDTAHMRTLVVIGVVDDPVARTRPPSESYMIYTPQDTSAGVPGLMVRTIAPAAPLLPAIREVMKREAPILVSEPRTLADIQTVNRRRVQIVTSGLSFAGTMALLLCAIGLYAVVAFSVNQRTHEIAVRLAVGARGNQIAQAFLSDGIKLSAIGMVIGLPLSLVALQQLMKFIGIYDVALSHVALIAAAGVIGVAAAAAWIPARRAAAVDPATVLRSA